MMLFTDLYFADPKQWILLILLPVYLLLVMISYYYYHKRLRNLFGTGQLRLLLQGRSLIRLLLKKGLIFIALASLIVALTDPQWGETEERKSGINSDIIILVDVSSSMLVEDIQPNRLEKVKLKISEFINLQRGNRIAITVFAGSAFVYTPLTTDYNSLQTFVKNISVTMVSKQGTDLTLGLSTSLKAFMDNDSQNILVVFTDGENHEQDYQEVVAQYVDRNITVFMIGVGSPRGEKIPLRNEAGLITEYLKDNSGEFVISKLDYTTLSDITRKTGGVYFPLTSEQDDILTINDYINQTQSRYEDAGTQKSTKSRYQIFATMAFLALLVEMLISIRKKEKILSPSSPDDGVVAKQRPRE